MSDPNIHPPQTAARLLIQSLEQQQVTHIFGIPGGKIMPVFDALVDGGPKLVLCRHEQNAAFMAAAVGRLTGRPGVCLVTSGPGTANLVTGMATATTEGDPMIAIGGTVPLSDTLKQTHQSMDAVALMRPVTKFSAEIRSPNATCEVVTNAFRAAMTPRQGAAFIAMPSDVAKQPANESVLPVMPLPSLGPASSVAIKSAAKMISAAKCPVVLVGMGASELSATAAVRSLLHHHAMPVVGTFQGAGVVSRELLPLFFGRVGLFRNQPGDKLLAKADVVLTIGYDPVEYDPEFWNVGRHRTIIHLDEIPCDVDNHYQPALELRGDIGATLADLSTRLLEKSLQLDDEANAIRKEWEALQHPSLPKGGPLVHPLAFVRNLRDMVDDDTVIACDIGSSYIWMARHFFAFKPRKLLFTNGQQTLGVGIPWAIAASIVHPTKKVIAICGDGGFLYSSMELETAIRLKSNITIFVFRDGSYNMVAFQQMNQFGRTSGVDFGNPDLVRYSESFGATALRVSNPDQLAPIMRKALETPGLVIVDIPIDYSGNVELGKHILPSEWD